MCYLNINVQFFTFFQTSNNRENHYNLIFPKNQRSEAHTTWRKLMINTKRLGQRMSLKTKLVVHIYNFIAYCF